MPVDTALIEGLRAEVLDAVIDDYVSIMLMRSFAKDVGGSLSRPDTRLLIIETLVSLVDHPDVKVVDGRSWRTIATPDDLRAHVERTWPMDGPDPLTGDVAWVVHRDFDLESARTGDTYTS